MHSGEAGNLFPELREQEREMRLITQFPEQTEASRDENQVPGSSVYRKYSGSLLCN